MQSQALIFDCDGTLIDSMPAHYKAWSDTFRRYGIEFTHQRFYELAGMPADKTAAIVAVENRVTLDPAKLAAEKDAQFLLCVGEVKSFEPVAAIARQNRGLLPMAVASGSARDLVYKELQIVGMLDWFKVIVCAEDVAAHKPAPDVFLMAARKLGVEPRDCTVYEDSDLGIQAAVAAGMQFVDARQLR